MGGTQGPSNPATEVGPGPREGPVEGRAGLLAVRLLFQAEHHGDSIPTGQGPAKMLGMDAPAPCSSGGGARNHSMNGHILR